MEKLFIRGNGEKVTRDRMAQLIAAYISEKPSADYEITVGTDSQNHSMTKMVEVIAIHRVGDGGIFFYFSEYVPKIQSLKAKITAETARSLENAYGLTDDVGLYLLEKDIDIDKLNINFQVHCDIGYYGKTRELIAEITAWVESCGYECHIKPESYAASGIANMISK